MNDSRLTFVVDISSRKQWRRFSPYSGAIQQLATYCTLAFVLSACQANPSGVTHIAPGEPATASEANPQSANRIKAIVDEVMNQQYGQNFDARLGCWAYTADLADDSHDFCMKTGTPMQVRIDGSEHLFFFASSRSDIDDDPNYGYGQAVPGLMGAFEIQIESPTHWKLMAASKNLTFGSVGNCGCQDARFVKLGRDYYGWQFSSGGVWQGVAIFNHNLVAAHGGTFSDLSAIPRIPESEQDTEYSLKVEETNDVPVYPLTVTKTVAGKSVTLTIPFDKQKWQYELPVTH